MAISKNQLENVSCNLCGADSPRLLFRSPPFSYLKCGRCGLIYVSPRLRDLTGWHARRYEAGRYGSGTGDDISHQFSPPRMARLEKEAKIYARYRRLNRVLDVGCSAGAFLAAARRQGWDAIGAEVSESCAASGREREGLDIRSGALRVAAFEGGSFDVVRMNNVLEHLPDPLGDLKEAARILRPGGLLRLSTINAGSLAAKLSGPDWRYYAPLCHVYAFTPGTLREMLSRAGFARIMIRTRGFRWGGRRSSWFLRKSGAIAARALGMGHRMRATAEKPAAPI